MKLSDLLINIDIEKMMADPDTEISGRAGVGLGEFTHPARGVPRIRRRAVRSAGRIDQPFRDGRGQDDPAAGRGKKAGGEDRPQGSAGADAERAEG